LDSRYVNWGFWRWRSHPPKIVEIAQANEIDLKIAPERKVEVSLNVVKGLSPCGVSYSIEANLAVPQNHPFSAVADVLTMLGTVRYSENLGTAILETEDGKCTVFANGHLLVVAPEHKADNILRKVVEVILRVQMCARCRICEKSCKRRAIMVEDTISIDGEKCKRCGRCAQGCIAAAEAKKLFGNFQRKQMQATAQEMPRN
jgi:phosphoadenosine phosphosulfate reductase